jgi:hypothetical protein
MLSLSTVNLSFSVDPGQRRHAARNYVNGRFCRKSNPRGWISGNMVSAQPASYADSIRFAVLTIAPALILLFSMPAICH